MKLVLLGQGRWMIYAVCLDEETCPLLDIVSELDKKRASKVLSDLREWVPHSSSAEWVRSDFSKKLEGTEHILEFRWPTRKGGTPRVYWFYDEGRVVVCTRGDNKKGETNKQDIDASEAVRLSYIEAKRVGDISIVTFEDFTTSENEET